MPIKKKEEVCGKPNQYNLQTLEYDWKELPDTHFQLPPQQPRVRNYSLAPPSSKWDNNNNNNGAANNGGGVGRQPQPKLNPITHQPLPSAGVAPSYTPLPSPSKPTQEDVNRGYNNNNNNNNNNNAYTPQGRYGNNNRKDHVADLFGDRTPSPARNAPARLSPTPLLEQQQQQQQPLQQQQPVPSPVYPYDENQRAMEAVPSPLPGPNAGAGAPYGYGGAASPAYRNDNYTVLPWSHEDIRRVVTSNALEAQRSYLR